MDVVKKLDRIKAENLLLTADPKNSGSPLYHIRVKILTDSVKI